MNSFYLLYQLNKEDEKYLVLCIFDLDFMFVVFLLKSLTH